MKGFGGFVDTDGAGLGCGGRSFSRLLEPVRALYTSQS